MIKKKPLQVTLEFLKGKITSGIWKSGDKIPSEKELEETIGVSRSTIRSSVENLSGLNLLEKKPGNGTYVKTIETENILENIAPILSLTKISYYDILECRMTLDLLAIDLFMDHPSSKDIKELRNILEKMKKTTDIDKFVELDLSFHRVVFNGSHNKALSLTSEILFLLVKGHSIDEYSKTSLEDKYLHHAKLFSAIENKNNDLAKTYEKSSFLENMERVKEFKIK